MNWFVFWIQKFNYNRGSGIGKPINWINEKRTRKTYLTKDQEVNLKNEAENQSNRQKRLAVNQSNKMQWPKTNLIIPSKS